MPATRKLVAIMFTDIVGYTALMQQSEQKAIEVRNKHRKVFNELTHSFNGQIIQYYGDGTLSIFESAVEAVKCAYELQLQFLTEPKVPVRIGLHMGDIIIDKEDIIGNAVNIASRIESAAVSGSVLFSEAILNEIKNHEEFSIEEIGEFHFKNDLKPRKIFSLANAGLHLPNRKLIKGKLENRVDQETNTAGSAAPAKKRSSTTSITLAAIALILLLALIAFSRYKRNWNQTNVLAQIGILEDSITLDPPLKRKGELAWHAFKLALDLETQIPDHPILSQKWNKICWKSQFRTEPAGAAISIKPYFSENENWINLGNTPIDSVWIPWGIYTVKVTKEGYFETKDVIRRDFWPPVFGKNEYTLVEDKLVPEGMVVVKGDSFTHKGQQIIIADYFMDQFEVSNAQYQQFVDAGGYQSKQYWNNPFVKAGDTLSWEQAMLLFEDKTGQPGPSTWEAGSFPSQRGDYPVNGISWFEAAAFAEFAGKSLPSIFHYHKTAFFTGTAEILSKSNINGIKLGEIGEFEGMGSFGVHDIAGNVREWTSNTYDRKVVEDAKIVFGGSWKDPEYVYSNIPHQFQQVFDRNESMGFRCVQRIAATAPEQNSQIEILQELPDNFNQQIASDEAFDFIRRQYDYSKRPLNHTRVYRKSTPHWTKEKITFTPAYDGDQMIAYLYLPNNAHPPFQTIIHFPGLDAVRKTNSEVHGYERLFSYYLKTGRAILLPVLAATFERKMGIGGPASNYKIEDAPDLTRTRSILMVKDIRRSIDYLETRDDIDLDRLGYLGWSQGGSEGPIVMAVENRIKTSVLVSCGLTHIFEKHPENARAIFLPRVSTPTMIINNYYDSNYPFLISQKPFFDLLGTDKNHQKVVLLNESSHKIPHLLLVKHSLEWYDKYFGKVQKTK